jgi:ferredoxin
MERRNKEMAYKIDENCIACGSCIAECKNGAIHDGEKISVINPARCTECVGVHENPECAIVCPVDAPIADPKHKESREELLAKWKKLHPGKPPAYV